MATGTQELFSLQPESDVRNNMFLHQPQYYMSNADSIIMGAPGRSSSYPQKVFAPVESVQQSPRPPSRLAGEPAFCAGRHCCQWTVGGCVCNNHYASAEELDRHIAADHAGKNFNVQPNADYHCYWAGCSKNESFGNKPKLTRHIHSHTGHKPHQCHHPGCDKSFVTKEQLKNHETTHTKTREYLCPECGKGFAVKTALTSHMNVHKGAKPYMCDECGKGFADSSNLSKHKAIHKRTSLKRAHTRRHTDCDGCEPDAIFPNPISTPISMLNPLYMPDYTVTSVEPLTQDPCIRPCFDVQCPETNRIPCRSVSPCKSIPCSNKECSPATFLPCPTDECVQQCPQDCGLDCGQNCFDDCFDDCHAQFCHEDYCHTAEECPVSPAQKPRPDQSAHTTPSQTTILTDEFHFSPGPRVTSNAMQSDFDFDESFKQLSDFVHGDFCGCVEQSVRTR